jgi:hypothetical protein
MYPMKTGKLLLFFCLISSYTFSQQNIFDLMEREDIRFSVANQWAEHYFDSVGTGQGSGYKQYQRWKFERKFHLDANGYFIKPSIERESYLQAIAAMPLPMSPTASYTELGPWSWTYTSGWNPGVGRITCIAVYPLDTTIIYVSSPGGGIWKSINSGTTWAPLVDYNSSYMNIFHLAIDPGNSN